MKIQDSYKTIEIDFTEDVQVLNDKLVSFLKAVDIFTSKVPCTKIHIRRDQVIHTLYEEFIETVDGRKWGQLWDLARGESLVSFRNITGFWTFSEYSPNTNIRDTAVQLIKQYEAIQIKVTWP